MKYRWYHIQKHNNREWGLKQKVLVQLFRTIILSKLLYCGLIWLDSPRNQEATDKFWYKALKNITGSVLNVSKELLEQITGIPPLSVIHKVNLIKFICKTISLDDREDPTSNMLLNICAKVKDIGVAIIEMNLPGKPQWDVLDFFISLHNFATSM